MHVVCFAGYSGSGKTTLIEQVIPVLTTRGLRVSVIKHTHHRFDVDTPGKDTWRHRQAGAYEVLAASDQRVVLMRELPAPQEPNVHALIAQLDSGHLSAALLDVFRQEPLPPEHPFWTHERITLTPHTSARTLAQDSIDQIVGKLAALARGEAVTGLVDLAKGY